MPSKAGRVRMPANNRLPVSASLKTSEIWKTSVGYDPYASKEEIDKKKKEEAKGKDNVEINKEAKTLFNLAKMTIGEASTIVPGACILCNVVGHLPYQCRNIMDLGDDKTDSKFKGDSEDDLKERKNLGLVDSEESSDNEESSDSEKSSGSEKSSDSNQNKRRRNNKKYKKKIYSDSSSNEMKHKHKHKHKKKKKKKRYSDSSSSESKYRHKHRNKRSANSISSESKHEKRKKYRSDKGLKDRKKRRSGHH